MHTLRTTTAIRRAKDAHAPNIRFRRAAAQRVLAGQVIAEDEVDVGARRPCRELGATRVDESERYDAVGDGPRLLDDQVGLVLPDDGLCGRHCHNRVRPSQQPTFVRIRTIAVRGRRGQGTCQPIVRIQIRLGPCAP
jgi:hypothetical protein